MRMSIDRGRTAGPWLAALAAWALLAPAQARGQLPPAIPAPAEGVEDRLRRLEAVNARLLERLDREREETDRRYRDLEGRYNELLRRVGDAPAYPAGERPAESREAPKATSGRAEVDTDADADGEAEGRRSHLGRPGEVGMSESARGLPLRARFADGFQLATRDDEFDLRFHVLDQTDFKVFNPNDNTFGKSGLYIPRVRVYLEGRLTRLWEYEVSLQRSLEGSWDLLDGNVNYRPSEAFQIKFGRMLVPYSFDWFDHLEQYFIAPERALFPLNFGLSRQAGLMAWGRAREGRLDYAVGGFNGHLAGLADNNPNQEAVGYFNARPFLHSSDRPALRNLNVGVSGAAGVVARNEDPLPLRTSVQAAENDEAARDASSIFLDFNDGSVYQGGRLFGALHLSYYRRGLSFETEWNAGRFQMTRPGLGSKPWVPVFGFHTTLGYFLTGEEVDRRTTVVPLRPFRPGRGEWGPGAFEVFARYSRLDLGHVVFTEGLADGRDWTADVGMTDLGLNWYPNRWVKIYLDWQHAAYGSPVLINEAKGVFGRSSDLLWVRCQVYF
ncbi:MAG: porin [Isosphaeraceae bacterium]